ncbi:uncharacterized protein LOC128551182 [Mercenaria mercenaria]|uniref:uncharacterized protein LOC128551182 n=1 Tax=Mercenaria mercenaria TaxID=6596 RepID=UPI00234EE388|nr:uncharacterized protein LOC128551182 [Mercenaria mercenaria]
MEKWICLFLCLLLPIYGTASSQLFGHMGCFDENSFPERNNIYYLFTMTGTSCMEICRSVSLRYAATKGHRCFCSKSISISPYTGSFKCNYTCPGNKTEICGGETSLSIYDTWAVQTTIRSTTTNSSMKITSEIASMSTEQVDHDTGRRTDDLVSVHISVPVLITVAVAISVAINVVIIFRLRRKRRKRRNSYRNRPRTTVGNSDDYLNASLPTNLQHHDNSYASIPNTHSDHRVTIVDNNYLNESLQSNFLHPVAANTDSNYASDSSHSVCIVSSEEHEYVDISYEELLSQRKDNHCYSQLKT